MLLHEVHFNRLVRLSSHFDAAVKQVHLIDEKVTEDTGAGNNDINTWSAKFLNGNEFDLVYAAKGVSNWSDSNKSKDLSKRFAVSLDVVSSPQSESNALGVVTIILVLELFEELPDNSLRHFHSSSGRDGSRIKGMHVTSSRENIRVPDGVSTRSRHEELAIKKFHDSSKLIISNNLLEAELEVGHDRSKTIFIDIREASINDGPSPWFLLAKEPREETTSLVKDILDLLHASITSSGLINEGTDSSTGGLNNLGVKLNIIEHTIVVATVDFIDVTADGCGNNAGKSFDIILRSIQLTNVHKSGNGFFSSWGHTNSVEATGKKTRLNLHDLRVHLSNNSVAVLGSIFRGIVRFKIREINVLVKIASVGS
mmetsp:Transcript_23624/g.69881  ORF Transcript_23624/g.69881 Transcript_23624/m.69881 type:complete len:369 (-) Transcript_23624:2621-3727(-)